MREARSMSNEQIKVYLCQRKPFFDCVRDIYEKGKKDGMKEVRDGRNQN